MSSAMMAAAAMMVASSGQKSSASSEQKKSVRKTEGKVVKFTLLEDRYCFPTNLQNLTDTELSLMLQEIQKEQKRRSYVNIAW